MTKQQKILIFLVLSITFYILSRIAAYWFADTLYTKAKGFNRSNSPAEAEKLLLSAIKISSHEPYYHLELSESYTKLSFPEKAIEESQKAIDLSPNNINLRRAQFSMYIRLSLIDPKYLLPAVSVLEEAIKMAPTDAKLFYNLALAYVRIGQEDKAVSIMQKTIDLKPNYKEARLAYAFFLIEKKEYQQARDQMNYILEKIDPADSLTKQTLEEIVPAQ